MNFLALLVKSADLNIKKLVRKMNSNKFFIKLSLNFYYILSSIKLTMVSPTPASISISISPVPIV